MVDEGASTGTLGKAVAVLDAIAKSPHPPKFRDLRTSIAQPPGTLHRNISNLVREGLVRVNPDQSYSLGYRLLTFASAAWAANRFREIAEPHLRALHQATQETVHLGVLQGLEVVYLDKVESKQAVRMHSQIGKASPAFCTGVGKAAMSVLQDDDMRLAVNSIDFHPFTDRTIMSAETLEAELLAIAQQGYGFDDEEHEDGIHCVAAPIHSHDKSFVGGISVTAPRYRVPKAQLNQWVPLVVKTAASITQDISIQLGPRA
ncbi:MAG: IclR family transcriptional regulator [Pseudomonadota bacterium]